MPRKDGTKAFYHDVDGLMERFQRRKAIGQVAWAASKFGPKDQRKARYTLFRTLMTREARYKDLTTDQVRQLDPWAISREYLERVK